MNAPDYSSQFNPVVAEIVKQRSGRSGYSALLAIQITEVGPGVIVCTMPVREELHSGVGAVHGGAIASLIDHTLSVAVYPLVEPGKWVATVEFKVNYLDIVREGILQATGRVLSLRKHIAVVSVEVENDGKLIAVAQGTLRVRERTLEKSEPATTSPQPT